MRHYASGNEHYLEYIVVSAMFNVHCSIALDIPNTDKINNIILACDLFSKELQDKSNYLSLKKRWRPRHL